MVGDAKDRLEEIEGNEDGTEHGVGAAGSGKVLSMEVVSEEVVEVEEGGGPRTRPMISVSLTPTAKPAITLSKPRSWVTPWTTGDPKTRMRADPRGKKMRIAKAINTPWAFW